MTEDIKAKTVNQDKELLEKIKKLEEENEKLKAMSKEPDETEKQKPAFPDPEEEYVAVTFFYDGDKYKDDIYVSVGSDNCLIKRGEPVKIKRKFLRVLQQQEKQDRKTQKLIKQYENQYQEAAKVMG